MWTFWGFKKSLCAVIVITNSPMRQQIRSETYRLSSIVKYYKKMLAVVFTYGAGWLLTIWSEHEDQMLTWWSNNIWMCRRSAACTCAQASVRSFSKLYNEGCERKRFSHVGGPAKRGMKSLTLWPLWFAKPVFIATISYWSINPAFFTRLNFCYRRLY